MATTVNGDTAPTPSPDDSTIAVAAADHSAHKRKREDTTHELHQSSQSQSRATHIQKDILDILERHDSQPSFLKHAFKSVSSNKKARLSNPSDANTTIAAKLSSASYASLQEVKADAALVAEELKSTIRTSAKDKEGSRSSLEDLKHIRRVEMIESLIKEIVDKEVTYGTMPGTQTVKPDKEEAGSSNGVDAEVPSTPTSNAVLTLWGMAPTPKQLFSSMQKPQASATGSTIKSELPVEEMSLPNGILATKVMPLPTSDSKGPTFEDAFAPPYSLSALQPPKAHKRPSTRDKDITWEFKDPIQRTRKGGYTVQPLTVGSWLNYGGTDVADATAIREKRRERTRALSSSGEKPEASSKAGSDEAMAKEEEALFRRAYSSFAPTYDNSSAVVPAEVRSLVWWHKVGNRRYNNTFALDPALLDESEPTLRKPLPIADDFQDDTFDTILQDLDELDTPEKTGPNVDSKTDIEQVLRQVSELLETLASHQRIRNAMLPSSGSTSRTPVSPSPSVATKSGKADEPSEAEIATYQSLQRELAYLVLKLPPYAVAKLNGDQLDELGVSKLITFQTEDTKGVMEEDLVARQAKMAALATASSIASLARPNSSAAQHYSTTANRTPAIGQAANTRYGQQYGSRTPMTAPAFQRQSSSSQSYGTPTASAPRPGYGQPNQWTRPGATQSGYGQPNGSQQYYQRSQQTSGGLSGFNQYQQQRYQTQTQQYPQRNPSQAAAANAVGYQTNTTPQPFNRTASPMKAFPPSATAGTPQHRPLYQAPTQSQQPGSGRATPTGYSNPHTPVNGFAPPPRQPPGIAPRPASSTPQPPTHQGPPPIQANGTT